MLVFGGASHGGAGVVFVVVEMVVMMACVWCVMWWLLWRRLVFVVLGGGGDGVCGVRRWLWRWLVVIMFCGGGDDGFVFGVIWWLWWFFVFGFLFNGWWKKVEVANRRLIITKVFMWWWGWCSRAKSYYVLLCLHYSFTCWLFVRLVYWILVGRSLLIWDRELVSISNFMGWLWYFIRSLGVEGCLNEFFLLSGGPVAFDLRSGVSF